MNIFNFYMMLLVFFDENCTKVNVAFEYKYGEVAIVLDLKGALQGVHLDIKIEKMHT